MLHGGKLFMKLLAALLLLTAVAAYAQPASCTPTVSVVPSVRAEGLADYVGDLVLVCTGGTPTPAGSPVPMVNLILTLNTFLTSKLLAPNWSEALVLVDEPGSGISPGTPQLACGAAGTVETFPGVCAITGTGTGAGVYSGTGARANVFQGRQSANNQVMWSLPMDAPAAGGLRLFRMTNVRANDAALGVPPTPPANVVYAVALTGPAIPTVVSPVGTFGFSLPSMTFSVVGAPTLPRCTPTNAALFASPAASGTPNFSVRFQETFPTAFKPRSGAAFAGPDVSPVPTAQDTPGTVTYNETDFYNPGFPAIAGRGDLSLAGLANQGTRFAVSFTGVPVGVELFVQTTAAMAKVSDGTPTSGIARLVSTAADGSGVFTPAPGNAFGIAPVPLTGGDGQAVFEVMNADAFNVERADVPIYVAFNRAHHGTAMAGGTLAPISTVGVSSATAPIPRFIDGRVPQTAFVLPNPCH
jgi:hypothetical protein